MNDLNSLIVLVVTLMRSPKPFTRLPNITPIVGHSIPISLATLNSLSVLLAATTAASLAASPTAGSKATGCGVRTCPRPRT